MMQKVFYVLFVVLLGVFHAAALKCYTCAITQSDIDQTCVTDPASVTSGSAITDCDKAYCTIVRIEYLDPPGVVQSMVRGCEDKPLYTNKIIEDSTYRTYYRACKQELCNSGSGKSTVSATSTNLSGATNLLVPGIGGSVQNHPTIYLIILTISLAIFY